VDLPPPGAHSFPGIDARSRPAAPLQAFLYFNISFRLPILAAEILTYIMHNEAEPKGLTLNEYG